MNDKIKRIVVKIGSSSLTHENGKINLRKLEQLSKVLVDLKNSGKEVILVSSGAMAVGVGKMGMQKKPDSIQGRQAIAAIGQCRLMFMYEKFFDEYGSTVAQVLLTRDVVDDKKRRENAVNTFESLINWGVIPIVNENDTVSFDEIVFGDNDHLSAIVASLCSADLLIMLTDTDGLYDSDPKANPDARLIEIVDEITPELVEAAGGSGSNRGTGGMHSKLEAAAYASCMGVDSVIMSGENPDNIYRLLDGCKVGTRFIGKIEE